MSTSLKRPKITLKKVVPKLGGKVDGIKIQKPFLKWVGGKTQIINEVLKQFPEEMNNYHEIFVGGGSILFGILTLKKEGVIKIKGKIYASDINDALISLYKQIQGNKEELFKHVQKHVKVYDSLKGSEVNRKPKNETEGKTSKESYYYWLRSKYNKMDKESVERSAIFLFMNKTCFRGVYREGPNGFNVPYGHYKTTPKIIDEDELKNISELLKDVVFSACDFETSLRNIKKGDFVYMDPPYAPENKKSFVGYVKDGFNLETHEKLFEEIKQLDKKGIKFVMSNSKVDLVIDNFKNYKMEELVARRAIHSKNPSSKTMEVIVYN